MANRNSAGFGFIPAGTLGNTPSTQGLSEYFIDAGDSANKFNGSAVQVTAGYIVTAEDAATAESVGVLQGIFYNAFVSSLLAGVIVAMYAFANVGFSVVAAL